MHPDFYKQKVLCFFLIFLNTFRLRSNDIARSDSKINLNFWSQAIEVITLQMPLVIKETSKKIHKKLTTFENMIF